LLAAFVNYDTIDHSVVHVDKLGYDTCGEQGKTGNSMTIGPGIQDSVRSALDPGDIYTAPCSAAYLVFCESLIEVALT